MNFHTVNPNDGKVINKYQYVTENEMESVLNQSHLTFNKWKHIGIDKKVTMITAFKDRLLANKTKLAKAAQQEMGKLIEEAEAEVEKCAILCDYYSENAHQILAPKNIQADGLEHQVSFEPLGTVLCIMPWNFPFWQTIRFSIPSLIVGNTVLLKHSDNVPECAKLTTDLFLEAGFDQGIFNHIYADHTQCEKIIRDSRIQGVSFTGSTRGGKEVAKIAGSALKKVVLELGGSDPFIVLKDADIEKAVEHAIKGRFLNSGQSCIAAKRILVDKQIEEVFITKFIDQIKNLKIAPLFSQKAVDDINRQVKASNRATTRYQESAEGKLGFYYPITVLTNIEDNMAVWSEEVFGPVAIIRRFDNEEEAIKLANDTCFGLGASIWSKDIKRAKKMGEEVNSGALFINSMVKSDPRVPFGGVKESGIGRELGEFGPIEFCNIKSTSVYA